MHNLKLSWGKVWLGGEDQFDEPVEGYDNQ
jgi:hypothetical protein